MALIDGDDLGRKRVDKTLEELEKDLEGIYQTASEEMQMKLDRYLERYSAREERYLAMVESGDMSIDEFNHWRENQILYSNGMRVQIEALTNDAVNADRIASDMINNTMPYVYSTSYNYMGFIGSMQAQYADMEIPAFPMVNMEAFRILATEDPTLIPINLDIEEDRRWNQQHITSAITQGIVQGEAIPQISRRLRQVTDMDSRAARRNARTACTYIENRGRREGVQKLRDAGIPFDEPWNATIDDRTRETHILLHGTLPNEDGYYGEGILDIRHKPLMREPADPDGALDEVYNCRCCVKAWLHGIDHSDFEDRYARFMTEEYYDDWERLGEERERHGYEDQERRFEQRRQEAQGRNEEIRRAYEEEQRQAQPAIAQNEFLDAERERLDALSGGKLGAQLSRTGMFDKQELLEAMKSGNLDDYREQYYQILEDNGDVTIRGERTNQNLPSEYTTPREAMEHDIRANALASGMTEAEIDQMFDEARTWFSNEWNRANTSYVDRFVDLTPTYDGVIQRGMHFENSADFDNFMQGVQQGSVIGMNGSNSSWTSSAETARRYAHYGDDEINSVLLVCDRNVTSSAACRYSGYSDEAEILASSTARWTVTRTEIETLPNGTRNAVIHLIERTNEI